MSLHLGKTHMYDMVVELQRCMKSSMCSGNGWRMEVSWKALASNGRWKRW